MGLAVPLPEQANEIDLAIDATDTRLLASPLGLGGQRCLGTLWLACGEPLARDRRERLLDAVRDTLGQAGADVRAGATCPHPQVLVVRALAPVLERAAHSLRGARCDTLSWRLVPTRGKRLTSGATWALGSVRQTHGSCIPNVLGALHLSSSS